MSTENRDGKGRSAHRPDEDWNEGVEEMDDFTVRGEAARSGPAGIDELPEDITGSANTERPLLDPIEDAEGDEPTLRPRSLDEFIGQEALKENLRIFVEAAKRRGEPLDHMLLAGPPGLGKTSLCRILAGEMDVGISVTSGPSLERAGDMAAILTSLEEGDFLFIDEIHRLNRQIEEVLYPAMEDFAMDIVLGQGPSARTIRMDLPRFTLVGATTRTGLMTKPLLDRFGFNARLDYYAPEDLKKIVVRNARILKIPTTDGGAEQLSTRSRGTPRIANRLLRRVRDYAEVVGDGTIDEETAKAALAMQGVDYLGLDPIDRDYLRLIIQKFDGGPVGVGTISVALGEARDTVEDVYEPYLLQSGLIQRTSRGRIATNRAYDHIGVPLTE
ncbi:MAG TPA: Holliday junction branch migration DNA helicase RuvB [Rubrobacteraceae bacterium]